MTYLFIFLKLFGNLNPVKNDELDLAKRDNSFSSWRIIVSVREFVHLHHPPAVSFSNGHLKLRPFLPLRACSLLQTV